MECGGEEREVAVKSLADGSTEEKRIQFLQEAATMGQFKHPNVITLHGVSDFDLYKTSLNLLTPQSQKEIMIVVELMKMGDLGVHLLFSIQYELARSAHLCFAFQRQL